MDLKKLFGKEETAPSCSAVILAAGNSQRMGNDKMFAALGGLPVLVQTLAVFQRSALVDEIVIVTRMDKLNQTAELVKKYGIDKVSKVICGGATRTESALAGVSEVRSRAKLIAIHDGARPLLTESLISRTVVAAQEKLSVIPVLPSVDTLKRVDAEGLVCGDVDRAVTMRVQTPQVFEASLIKGALTRAVKNNLTLTDDCSAIALLNVKTYTVPGEEDNIKLTTPHDMILAEAIMRNRGELYADRPWL